MPSLFWAASGLAKHYIAEVGSQTANLLFAAASQPVMLTTLWGYSETFSLIRRAYNGGRVDASVYATATSALRNDILALPRLQLVSVADADILYSITYIQRHNINATDAALLATLLRYAQATGETCVLVAADGRFCRAASAEGLAVINPETSTAADLPAFLAAL